MDPTESEQTLTRGPSRAPIFRLLCSGGHVLLAPAALALPFGLTKIGRDIEDAQGIRLPLSRRASREHAVCEICPQDGQLAVHIRDLGSKNGTWINGQRCDAVKLEDGDLVRIGDSLLLLRFEAANQEDAVIPSIQGISPSIRTLRKRLADLAATTAPVLLLGESGTGKDLMARALHDLSSRRGRFVPVNCSAIPESLAESSLFGHISSSFAGAVSSQEGFFRAAQGGTLFLDEIGELTPAVQPKLLRAIEDQVIAPVGSTRTTQLDVRIVAATNRNLKKEIATGRFRSDLYSRLCGLSLRSPPLRTRREDILSFISTALGIGHRPLSTSLAEALVLYDWPLNVRELRQMAIHLQYSATDNQEFDLSLLDDRLAHSISAAPAAIRARHAEQLVGSASSSSEVAALPMKPLPRDEVERLLRAHRGIVSRVATAAGRSPRQIRRWIEQYGIDLKQFES